MESVAGGRFNSFCFRAIHSQKWTLAIAAEDQPGAPRVPLGEGGADDRFVRGRAGDVVKGEFYIERDRDGGDESSRTKGEKFSDIRYSSIVGRISGFDFRIEHQQDCAKGRSPIAGDQSPCNGGGIAQVERRLQLERRFHRFRTVLGFE